MELSKELAVDVQGALIGSSSRCAPASIATAGRRRGQSGTPRILYRTPCSGPSPSSGRSIRRSRARKRTFCAREQSLDRPGTASRSGRSQPNRDGGGSFAPGRGSRRGARADELAVAAGVCCLRLNRPGCRLGRRACGRLPSVYVVPCTYISGLGDPHGIWIGRGGQLIVWIIHPSSRLPTDSPPPGTTVASAVDSTRTRRPVG
jgi:hypothetical protein